MCIFISGAGERCANFIEQAIYGQYPEVEIFEVEDYASKFKYDPKKHWMFRDRLAQRAARKGRKYGQGKFPGIDVYPIKTYIDYELDKDPKEEFKVDPLGSIIEFMGSLQPQEQIGSRSCSAACGKYGILSTHDRDNEWR